MMLRSALMKISQQETFNFLLTNRIPRRLATRLMGWFSRIEHPLVCEASLRIWRLFAELDLSDARETRFRSLHHCFTRQLRDGARPVNPDPDVLVSPCDGIVGASGTVEDGRVLQVKGRSYRIEELLGGAPHAAIFRRGCYVTLRLTSGMYHRFHAPHDCRVEHVTHIPGDMWNVNPIALARVERLFCRNERAVIRMRLRPSGHPLVLVPVAAILVAGLKLRFLEMAPDRAGRCRQEFPCSAVLGRGEEMGWFEHGSTILVFAPEGFRLGPAVVEGGTIRVGQELMHLPPGARQPGESRST